MQYDDRKFIAREVYNQLKLVGHSAIIELCDVSRITRFLILHLEYCAGNTLRAHMNMRSRPMSEKEALIIFRQIILAVDYMHSKDICMRDLKPENILFANQDREDLIVKLCDFGYSKDISIDSIPNSLAGSPDYAPPEVFQTDWRSDAQYEGKPVDIWCVGGTLFFLICNELPFKPYQDDPQRRFRFPPGINLSDGVRDIIKKMLVAGTLVDGSLLVFPPSTSSVLIVSDSSTLRFIADPRDRITSTKLLDHPWVTQDLNHEEKLALQSYNETVKESFKYRLDAVVRC